MCILTHFTRVQLFATLWTIETVACQAPLSMGFSRQEYWRGLPFPPPGAPPKPGIKPASPYISCIGRQVLYHLVKCHLGSPHSDHNSSLIRNRRNIVDRVVGWWSEFKVRGKIHLSEATKLFHSS